MGDVYIIKEFDGRNIDILINVHADIREVRDVMEARYKTRTKQEVPTT